MTENKTKTIQFRVDIETYEKAKAAAEADGRELSNLMRKLLSDYLNNH